jgi:hypothetical protein
LNLTFHSLGSQTFLLQYCRVGTCMVIDQKKILCSKINRRWNEMIFFSILNCFFFLEKRKRRHDGDHKHIFPILFFYLSWLYMSSSINHPSCSNQLILPIELDVRMPLWYRFTDSITNWKGKEWRNEKRKEAFDQWAFQINLWSLGRSEESTNRQFFLSRNNRNINFAQNFIRNINFAQNLRNSSTSFHALSKIQKRFSQFIFLKIF